MGRRVRKNSSTNSSKVLLTGGYKVEADEYGGCVRGSECCDGGNEVGGWGCEVGGV